MKQQITAQRVVMYVLILLTLFFLSKNLWTDWQSVTNYEFSLDFARLLSASIMLIAAYVSFAVMWNTILRKTETQSTLSHFQAVKIYMMTELAKYLPGKIWSVTGKIYLGARLGIPKKSLLVSSLINAVLHIIGILFVGAVFLILSLPVYPAIVLLTAVVIIALGLIGLHPKIFYPITNFILNKIGKNSIPKEMGLSYKKIIKFFITYMAVDIFLGAAFYVFVAALTPVSVDNFFLIVSSFCLASGLGMVAFFTPSGLGVREGVMVAILQLVIPGPVAVLVSFFARVWVTIAEIVLLAIVVVMSKISVLTKERGS